MAVNGLYIVQGELNSVVALLRRAHRSWVPSHQQIHHQPSLLDEQDPLLRNFADLREVLNSVADLADMAPNTFLSPFLDVVRSEQTTGPVTGQALSSVGKFLSYGLVDPMSMTAASAVENIADAVTHARFVGGTDTRGDEVVLLKILQVLRTLLLTPVGRLLTNESVCEVMQSCFRICFETRLSELLRKAAESTLADMIQLLFTRLPTFKEDSRHPYIRKLKMRASSGYDSVKRHRYGKKKQSKGPLKSVLKQTKPTEVKTDDVDSDIVEGNDIECPTEQGIVEIERDTQTSTVLTDEKSEMVETEAAAVQETIESVVQEVEKSVEEKDVVDLHGKEEHVVDLHGNLIMPQDDLTSSVDLPSQNSQVDLTQISVQSKTENETESEIVDEKSSEIVTKEDEKKVDDIKSRVNQRGVRFTKDIENENETQTGTDRKGNEITSGPHIPYGLPCVREVLRFLISLTTPLDRQNTEQMLHLGLNLLIVAFEAGADHLGSYSLLLPLVKNELCRSLLSLLEIDRLPIFASALRLCFLLFESLRTHLKFQLERYLQRLMDIIGSEQIKTSFEQKEMSLEALDQLWRIPGYVTELYLNYDCDLYCSDLFYNITELLYKNATNTYTVSGAIYSTNILALDALLTVVETIDTNCIYRSSCAEQQKQSNVEIGTEPTSKLELPAVSGYAIGKEITEKYGDNDQIERQQQQIPQTLLPIMQVRANRMPYSGNIPSHAELISRKDRKKLIKEGTERFNAHPIKGIGFLQEQGLLQSPLIAEEVVGWLKENPGLNKQKIAEYIVSRKNSAVLEAFVRSFPFDGVRIDDALRLFLETFRLPGEAAEISMVMTHFSDHWFKSNDEPFHNSDAAFTLSYAVIMLNTDQHNPQVRRNQPPMTIDCFKRNLSGCNGGGDFDQDLLDDIFHGIRNDEIVMPAEQIGLVKDNYLWKVLLRRGLTKEGEFIHAPSGWYDHALFSLIWSQSLVSLKSVFETSDQDIIIQKAVSGFRKIASIAAHYGKSDVLDKLIISLCKSATLVITSADSRLSSVERSGSADAREPVQAFAIGFGQNQKAQIASKVMFELVHEHGDILRESWTKVLESLLQLFKSSLLPKTLTESEDFVDAKGWVSIIRQPTTKEPPKSDSGLLSSLVFYLGGSGPDPKEPRPPTAEEQEMIKLANSIITECHPEQLITDSKYLTSGSLVELFQALVSSSGRATGELSEQKSSLQSESVENALVFYLELMITIALENKDRLALFWKTVSNHVQSLLVNFPKNRFLMERAVVGLLRLTNRNLFRMKDDISDEVLHSLNILTMVRPSMVFHLSQEISFGLHELLRNNAANVHRREHWSILFALLEAAGAAAFPNVNYGHSPDEEPKLGHDYCSDGDHEHNSGRRRSIKDEQSIDRGYTSDSEILVRSIRSSESNYSLSGSRAESGEWMYVDNSKEGPKVTPTTAIEPGPLSMPIPSIRRFTFDKTCIILRSNLGKHEPKAFIKCCETLAFLVRDAAHITPENFESCVQCLRTFVEASLDGGSYAAFNRQDSTDGINQSVGKDRKFTLHKGSKMRHSNTSPSVRQQKPREPLSVQDSTAEDETPQEETLSDNYHQVSHQLIDLCHTLHVKAAGIFRSWATVATEQGHNTNINGEFLWINCWRPLLQCIARLCCDCRRQIRNQALNYLQRSFLVHDLQAMGAAQWEDCFAQVLFPLLAKLLDNVSTMDPIGMEDSRVRATGLLSKVLLNHLSPLSTSSSFTSLWLTILDFMERYLHTDRSEALSEAIPESLKNMVLVMDNTGMFLGIPGLYGYTKERLSAFLPALIEEVLPNPPLDPSPTVTSYSIISSPPHGDGSHAGLNTSTRENVTEHIATHEPLQEVVVTGHQLGRPSGHGLFNPQSDLTPAVPIILHPPAAEVISAPLEPAVQLTSEGDDTSDTQK